MGAILVETIIPLSDDLSIVGLLQVHTFWSKNLRGCWKEMITAEKTPHTSSSLSDQAKLRKGDKVGARRLDYSSLGIPRVNGSGTDRTG